MNRIAFKCASGAYDLVSLMVHNDSLLIQWGQSRPDDHPLYQLECITFSDNPELAALLLPAGVGADA